MNFHEKPQVYAPTVELKVASLERSLAFYQEVIGLKVLEHSTTTASLTADEVNVLINLVQPDNVTPRNERNTGLYHLALLVPTRKDLGIVLKHLIETRNPLQGGSDHLVSEAIYLADPDMNGIEIYVDRPSENWQWHNEYVVMDSKRLDVEGLLALAENESFTGLPKGTIMGHIHLQVSDLASTEKFYCDGLGFDVVTKYGAQALFISTGRYHHHIGLNTWHSAGGSAASESSAGLKNFTLLYPSEEEKLKVVNRLKDMGATVFVEDGTTFTKDPSGITIKLLVG
ncbi:glyoxalase [Bacillus sp. AFS002410]|uniref:VOC family protein n=1 Tax=Bacillus sp. AFS002410 TaxID=2033481 RepID=UPI000BF1B351|nr:VOC family protein [Bacillus sp. AFS002410]PEJ56886.1 glyoxalase [Bacillus sp. AFS002410]